MVNYTVDFSECKKTSKERFPVGLFNVKFSIFGNEGKSVVLVLEHSRPLVSKEVKLLVLCKVDSGEGREQQS